MKSGRIICNIQESKIYFCRIKRRTNPSIRSYLYDKNYKKKNIEKINQYSYQRLVFQKRRIPFFQNPFQDKEYHYLRIQKNLFKMKHVMTETFFILLASVCSFFLFFFTLNFYDFFTALKAAGFPLALMLWDLFDYEKKIRIDILQTTIGKS